MIHVFKTSVQTYKDIEVLKPKLDNLTEINKWGFDLDDCENILRIDSKESSPKKVIDVLEELNFKCIELE